MGDQVAQHQEGIDHIKAKSSIEDNALGTEGGVADSSATGGVSSSAYVGSPTSTGSTSEQTQSQGGIVDTVKGYLGLGGSSTTSTAPTHGDPVGGTHAETTSKDPLNYADSSDGTNTTLGKSWAGQTQSNSGSGSGIAGTAATIASAAGLTGSGLESNQRSSAADGDVGLPTIGQGSTSGTTSGLGSTSGTSATDRTGSSSSPSTNAGNNSSTLESAKEKVQEVTNTGGSKENTSGHSEDKTPMQSGANPAKRENESAIPTAGGERLGEKHWGESKIVPEVPKDRESTAGISSAEGQSTQQTADNTAANTGGATGPPSSSNKGSTDSGEKPKTMDKIKEKLHMGGK